MFLNIFSFSIFIRNNGRVSVASAAEIRVRTLKKELLIAIRLTARTLDEFAGNGSKELIVSSSF